MPKAQFFVHPMMTAIGLPTTLALAIIMAGCSDNSSTSTSQTQNIDPSVLAEKQEIIINNFSEPASLDPHKVSSDVENNILRQMFEGLTMSDKDGAIGPGMAESWNSEDNQVWTFKLRDAKWSNGDPVTADDFVYSLRRLVDPMTASPYASYLEDAKVAGAEAIIEGKAKPDTLGVKAIDAKTLQISLSEPVPYLPDMMAHMSVFPVHKATVEKFGDKWTDPANTVVNGAYKLSEWQINDKIVLTRNTGYYNDAKTHINKVTFLPINSSETGLTRYKAGELDVTAGVPTEQFASAKAELGDQITISPKLCTYYYAFNNTKAPFDDARVRRALAIALDRDIIADKVLGQGQMPAYQLTPLATNGVIENTPEWTTWDKAKRIAEAKKLLNEAGYSESKPLRFELFYNTNDDHKKIAVAAVALWKEALGFVDITLNNQEWKTYMETINSGKYQMGRYAWCGDYNEPSTFLNIFKTGNSNNYSKYTSPTFDNLMTQTLKPGISAEQRSQLYAQAEAQLDKDMPVALVYHYVDVRVTKPYVIGFPLKDPLSYWKVKDLSIAKHD